MVSSGECVTDEVSTDKLQRQDAASALQQISDSKTDLPQSDQRGTTSIKAEEPSLTCSGVQTSKSVQGGMISDKTSLTPDRTPPSLPAKEGSTPMVREKASEDGYHWRKYGQKLVKGNEFVRSYYKCTYQNCKVKKQLEYAHDGKMVDTVYFGHHDHPKPLNLPLAVGVVVSVVEEKPDNGSPLVVKDNSLDAYIQMPHQIEPRNDLQPLADASSNGVKGATSKSSRTQNVACSDDDPHMSKRRKKEHSNADGTPGEKPTTESRMVVKTLSEVDIVNDGYRWRKYGQKLVKGNPNPRSYYRCSHSGCPVKKHVERASHDVNLVITTYEGRHDHDMPPTRTVTHNTTGINVHSSSSNDESGTKVEESKTACHDMGVHSSCGPENKSSEQLNVQSTIKSEVSSTARSDVINIPLSGPEIGSNEQWNTTKSEVSSTAHSDVVNIPLSGPESGSNEQRSGKFDPGKESDAVGCDMIVQGESGSQTTSNEQLGVKLETKSDNDTVCIDKMVHITPKSECKFDEWGMPSPEPIQS
ncbi:DNA-binding WRKY [Corchorus olitorius]|uniref:DNA-binding WRKY n=1 Tax=Corchorus olitorius TaxID=93759 RepID=A0A1R3GWS3_9ROSI|nr:DNA-binding WRKY [Corchorus olitorius]